jgi:hypothetical protein
MTNKDGFKYLEEHFDEILANIKRWLYICEK